MTCYLAHSNWRVIQSKTPLITFYWSESAGPPLPILHFLPSSIITLIIISVVVVVVVVVSSLVFFHYLFFWIVDL